MRTIALSKDVLVGEIGYGLMGLTWRPNPPSEEQAFKAMKAALVQGCNFWNAGEFYGTAENNSLTLLKNYFTKYPEDADKVVLSMKGCLDPQTLVPNCTPAGLRSSVENCIRLLPPSIKTIDFFEPARLEPSVAVEETVATLVELINEGKIKHGYMLSEVRGSTIRRAHKIHPVSGVEVELSVWEMEVLGEEHGAAAVCAELGVPLVAYSPIGRGMLTGEIRSHDDIPEGDFRKHSPRFQPDVFSVNIKLVDELQKLAVKKGVSSSQLAISWVLARRRYFKSSSSDQLTVIPIPGSSFEGRVVENASAKDVEWTEEDEKEVSRILGVFEVKGGRYPEGATKFLAQ